MTVVQRASIARLRRGAFYAAGAAGAATFLWIVYLGLTWDLRRSEDEPPAEYRRVAVRRGDLRETVVATGRMQPWSRVVVQSEVPGIVAEVHVDDGDRVTAGAPLVDLDDSRLADRAAELRAALAHREALARVDLVGRAAALLAEARHDHDRLERLRGRGVVSEETLEDAAHAVRLAEIDLADARAERDARLAASDEARKALARVERDLERSTIRSPIDGVVVRRRVEVGAAVADLQNGGTVIAELADDSRIHLLGEVDENDVAGVRVGQPAEIRIDAFPDEVFPGRVRKIASAGSGDGSISIFEIEVELQPDPRIRVGMSADARVVVREHSHALLVPNAAIVRTPEGPRVRRAAGTGDDPDARLVDIHEIYSDGFVTAVAERDGPAAAADGNGHGGLSDGDAVLVRASADER